MENQINPFEEYLKIIENKIRQETLPEKIQKLPEGEKIEVVCSLASIATIQESLKSLAETSIETTEKQENQRAFHIQYPFIHHLISFKLEKIEEPMKEKLKNSLIKLVPIITQKLQDAKFLQDCYQEFGINGKVDIKFITREQQNSATMLTTLLEKIIWIQISQESLSVLGTGILQDKGKEPDPIKEFYEEVISTNQDFSGIDYMRKLHIPHLKQAYLQSLANQSSPKTDPEDEEEKIWNIIEKKMSPSVYKDWQVSAVIIKIYEETREEIRKKLQEEN